MNILRKALFPLSWMYDGITRLRNVAYSLGWLKSESFSIPTIVVGNLSAGGTGKTPMTAYLIELLQKDYKIAVLSRGYKRKTSGFQMANSKSTTAQLGDESFQLYQKFDDVVVAVDEDRPHGVQSLISNHPDLEGILLDDAYQHRKLEPSFRILLTTYDQPWFRDCLLPSGNLREAAVGKNRADVVVRYTLRGGNPNAVSGRVSTIQDNMAVEQIVEALTPDAVEPVAATPVLEPKPEPIDDEVAFRIQILATHAKVSSQAVKRIYAYPGEVRHEQHSDWHKYTTGYHTTYQAARDNRVDLSSNHAFPGPFVTAYRSGQRITVQEALLVTKQNWIP